jgi:hypothetical protein
MRRYHVPHLVEVGRSGVRRIWLRGALAAGAGLASLVVCSAVAVASLLLLSNAAEWWYFIYGIPSSGPSPIFWVGLVILLIVATAGLSLPARALGARGRHLTKTAVLSVLGFCASVVFVVASLVIPLGAPPLALMAIVATPLIGSLFAIREDYRYTVGLVEGPALIGAGAIYCASLLATLLAIWLSRVEEGWHFLPPLVLPLIVASSSWVVVPGIVAALRPG